VGAEESTTNGARDWAQWDYDEMKHKHKTVWLSHLHTITEVQSVIYSPKRIG